MTHQEILEKAISKAIENGWRNDELHEAWNDGDKGYDAWTKEDILRDVLSDIKYECGYMPYIYNHDFARAIWGEHTKPIWNNHVTRSSMPGYVDTTYPLHNSADIMMVQEEDMKCFECGKVLAGPYWINQPCWSDDGEYNAGWQYHLQQMVVADDPIAYLQDNIPGDSDAH